MNGSRSRIPRPASRWTLSHYQKIELGALDPRLSTVVKLAETFGMPVAELLKGIQSSVLDSLDCHA
jgi:transcriptional regulator with XRE-family HTH domain